MLEILSDLFAPCQEKRDAESETLDVWVVQGFPLQILGAAAAARLVNWLLPVLLFVFMTKPEAVRCHAGRPQSVHLAVESVSGSFTNPGRHHSSFAKQCSVNTNFYRG